MSFEVVKTQTDLSTNLGVGPTGRTISITCEAHTDYLPDDTEGHKGASKSQSYITFTWQARYTIAVVFGSEHSAIIVPKAWKTIAATKYDTVSTANQSYNRFIKAERQVLRFSGMAPSV